MLVPRSSDLDPWGYAPVPLRGRALRAKPRLCLGQGFALLGLWPMALRASALLRKAGGFAPMGYAHKLCFAKARLRLRGLRPNPS